MFPCFRPARRTSRPSRPCVRVLCTVYSMTVSCVPVFQASTTYVTAVQTLCPCTVYRVLYDRVLCSRVSGQHDVRHGRPDLVSVYCVPCTVYRMTVSVPPVFQASTTYVTAVQTLCPCTVYCVPYDRVCAPRVSGQHDV